MKLIRLINIFCILAVFNILVSIGCAIADCYVDNLIVSDFLYRFSYGSMILALVNMIAILFTIVLWAKEN